MSDRLPIIAGHQLRTHIVVEVGDTGKAFREIGEAIDYAGAHPVTLAVLDDEYTRFILESGHDHLGRADEHLFDERLTDAQRLWLVDFCWRWKSVELHERAMA